MLTVAFVGMKAECRQFAVQTHHIDPHNDGFKYTRQKSYESRYDSYGPKPYNF